MTNQILRCPQFEFLWNSFSWTKSEGVHLILGFLKKIFYMELSYRSKHGNWYECYPKVPNIYYPLACTYYTQCYIMCRLEENGTIIIVVNIIPDSTVFVWTLIWNYPNCVGLFESRLEELNLDSNGLSKFFYERKKKTPNKKKTKKN